MTRVRESLFRADLSDEATVKRILAFAKQIVELFEADPTSDKRMLIRLRNNLRDDGYDLSDDQGDDDVAGFKINKPGIEKMMAQIQREFDKHSITVPITAQDGVTPASIVYNGPVIHGDANHAQLAWNNQSVTQSTNEKTVSHGYEGLAQAIVAILRELPNVGLDASDLDDATQAANEVLVEVTEETPDKGKIRKAVAAIKGFLAPIAMGISTGAAKGASAGADEWARTAIEQLSHHQF